LSRRAGDRRTVLRDHPQDEMHSLGAASRIGPPDGREGEERDYVVAALLLREMMHVPEKI